jgi:ATP-dependent RNA helicase DDX41
MSAAEIATGVQYTESIKTGWQPPRHIRDMTEKDCEVRLALRAASHHLEDSSTDRVCVDRQGFRKKWHIICDGIEIPPPIKNFKDMRFPEPILNALAKKGIKKPTPIQVQGLPVLLSGRDMIGIAFTGSGKTITFSLPLIMLAAAEEKKVRIMGGEGPFGIILCPSRELATQTYEVVKYFCEEMAAGGLPELRALLCIGGQDKRSQTEPVRERGVHVVVATPGRLKDLLMNGKMNLNLCKYFCLDEADRMLDLGFDEEVAEIMNHFKHQRQTLLFSATMPQKIQDFAKQVLVRPVLVNVGRAGAANLDVIQEVEYVKKEAKIVYLLQCLQKTPPPVMIFCERKSDVDDIHEYLLLKGVEAVSIHGSKDQSERDEAIKEFKSGRRDVLVATDVAAKGLDFPNIEHVINFDMPSEIENYVHRIGRTGRCGKTGVATTFVNNEVQQSTLLDLKHLLIEAKQRVPPCLDALDDPDSDIREIDGMRGCSFCGGLGHRITDCPKIDKDARHLRAGKRDMLAGNGGYGGEY